jgi:hypothetical protein
VLIQISRMVRVTLSETELQTLRPGEFYDVPPAVGRVLVSEGWAVEPGDDAQDGWNDGPMSPYDDPRRPPTS